jgi:WD40 repeat protein
MREPQPTVPGYAMLGMLGRGGMGVVYKARHLGLKREVALKMMLHAEHAGADQHQRFQAEAEAVARLQHPHIVQVYDVGEHNGLPYFSMEYCAGGSLAGQLDGTPWDGRRAANLVQTLATAMQAAHAAGVVHRDLKPRNVLLTADGTPKVTDFGLAKRLDVPGLTATGAVLGTPSYMAPEQASGKSRAVGPTADVYALGAILYECLTGRPPFRATTAVDTVLQVVSDEPVAVRKLQPKLHRDLETICHKCLQKEPTKRYGSAEALAEDLRRFGAGEPVKARPMGVQGRAVRWARRRPAIAGLLALVAFVGVGGLAGIVWAYGQAVREGKAARQAEGRAREEAERARQETQRADENAAEASRKEYLAQIRSVAAELQNGDCGSAAGVLERMETDHRGWEYGYLRRRAEGTPLTLRGHTHWVNSVAYSPDGSRIASASWREVKVWDARIGLDLATLRGHTNKITSVCYSPDGRQLASASADKTIKLWDAERGTELATLRGHAEQIESVAFSPDGRQLASASWDQTVKLWDARTGAELATLRGHAGRVNAVAYSPDGSRLASGSLDQTVKVWDAHTGTLLATLRGHTRWVNAVAYSPDGLGLASGSTDGTVRIWDARTGAERRTLRGHKEVKSVSYSPDGTRLASASRDKTIKVWDAHTGDDLLTLLGHAEEVSWLAYSPDGYRIASASADKTVKVWDARSSADPAARLVWQNVVTFNSDGSRIAGDSPEGAVRICDARTGAEITRLPRQKDMVMAVRFSPDGTRLAVSSGLKNPTIKVWDAHSGAEVFTLRGHATPVQAVVYSPDGTRLASSSGFEDPAIKVWGALTGAELLTWRGHQGGAAALSYSPDGSRLASASYDGTVMVWDAGTGAKVFPRPLRGHVNQVHSVVYSPDGTRLASASEDKTVRVWDARTGDELLTLRGHTHSVRVVTYTRDGSRVVSGSFDGTVKVWDARTGDEILTLRDQPGGATALAFSPDGSRLAHAPASPTAWIWDARHKADARILGRHTDSVTAVTYSPDGCHLASAAQDGTMNVWDVRTGAEVLTLRGHATMVFSLTYSPDGSRLASAGDDTVKVWDAHSGAEVLSLGEKSRRAIAVAYSFDGSRLITTSIDGTRKAWEASTGQLLVNEPVPQLLPASNVSPDGKVVAVPQDEAVRLWQRRPEPGDYDPWAEDLERRRVLAPSWHAEDAATAEHKGDSFAATFHRRRLAQGDNLRVLAWAQLASGNRAACVQTIRILQERHRFLAGLASAGSLFTALAAGPTPGLCGAAAAPLAAEQRRVAVQLVRTAVLLEDSVSTAKLLALARYCSAAEPESWPAHELLGAALYRDGQAAAAVGELEEAVRRHGDGSLWAKLFLALAHRRLGHADKAQEYRRQALAAAGWEEGVLQAQLFGEFDRAPKEK